MTEMHGIRMFKVALVVDVKGQSDEFISKGKAVMASLGSNTNIIDHTCRQLETGKWLSETRALISMLLREHPTEEGVKAGLKEQSTDALSFSLVSLTVTEIVQA